MYFDPPAFKFQAEHVGLFWSRIKKKYPTVRQQAPIGTIIDATGEIFPMPRFWLTSDDESTLIQLQKNAFIFNWRRRAASYPHFDRLMDDYDRLYLMFSDFLKTETDSSELNINLCELTYINLIEPAEYWSDILHTSSVIPSFKFVDFPASNANIQDFNYATVYDLGDDLSIRVTVRNVHPTDQPEQSNLVFEIRASGRIGSSAKADADAWLERAHAEIGKGFVGMTSSEIQSKYWQPKDCA